MACESCGELKQLDIGSPLLTLIALYWVAENRPEWTGIDGKTMLSTAFGIASADYIRDKVKELAPDFAATLGDEALQAIIGALIVKFGRGKLDGLAENFGRGVLLDVAARAMKEMGLTLESFLGGVFGGGKVKQEVEIKQEVNQHLIQPQTLEEYVLAKYGVRP